LLLCTSPISWQLDSPVLASPDSRQQETTLIYSLALSLSPAVISRCRSWEMLLVKFMWGRRQHLTGYCCWLTKVCGASGYTLYWVLLLAYVGSRATHFTEHCCWFTKVCGASGNTHYWVLLLVYMGSRETHLTGYRCWAYVGPRATHLTGNCCWFTWGRSLYWVWCGPSAMGLK
jgi:hypothetical protein